VFQTATTLAWPLIMHVIYVLPLTDSGVKHIARPNHPHPPAQSHHQSAKACSFSLETAPVASSASNRGPLLSGSRSGSKLDISNGSLLTTGKYGGVMRLCMSPSQSKPARNRAEACLLGAEAGADTLAQ